MNGVNNGMNIKFMSELTLKPIGYFKSEQIEPYDASRQPDELGKNGIIELIAGENYEQALADLESCTHLWIIFGFHLNQNWKPMVQTPRSEKKIGVFATRAPYRPNPIGMSVVQLVSVDGLKIHVSENDILNGSPIYDIKPYHPEHDFIPKAKIGWLQSSNLKKQQITFSPLAKEQMAFLKSSDVDLKPFITRQLEYDPTNKDKKRVNEGLGYWTLAYRTWRIDFSVTENKVAILSIRSGYTEDDLKKNEDLYSDKDLHRQFNKEFS